MSTKLSKENNKKLIKSVRYGRDFETIYTYQLNLETYKLQREKIKLREQIVRALKLAKEELNNHENIYRRYTDRMDDLSFIIAKLEENLDNLAR